MGAPLEEQVKDQDSQVQQPVALEAGDSHEIVFTGHTRVEIQIARTASSERALIIKVLGKEVPPVQYSVDAEGNETEHVSKETGGAYFPMAKVIDHTLKPQVIIESTMHPEGYHVRAISGGKGQVLPE